MNVKLYTDGACSGNPGPGGFGVILSTVMPDGKIYEVKHSQGFRFTTNNRMELGSVIFGLSSLNGQHNVEVITDSKYVSEAFNQKWIQGWQKLGWRKKTGPLPNADLWKQLWELVCNQQSVKFTWIKGHKGHPYNEECDRLAVLARQSKASLLIDKEYELSIQNWN